MEKTRKKESKEKSWKREMFKIFLFGLAGALLGNTLISKIKKG